MNDEPNRKLWCYYGEMVDPPDTTQSRVWSATPLLLLWPSFFQPLISFVFYGGEASMHGQPFSVNQNATWEMQCVPLHPSNLKPML
jgi:hypothetical protein